MRIAVVGAGGIAQRYHLPSLQRLANQDCALELAAVCDVRAEVAEIARTRWGFQRAFSDYRVMLDAVAPDAVWVLVSVPATCTVAGFFLARKVPTFLEKPPGENADETRALIEIAAVHDTPHQVAFNRRYAPLLVRMKALLDDAGGVQAISCQFYRVQRNEAHFPFATGLHGLDTLRFLGGEVCAVQTRPGPRGSALVTLIYESGGLGLMEMLPQVGLQSERYTAHAGDRTVVVEGVIGWLTHFPGFMECYEGGQRRLTLDNAGTSDPPEVVSGFYGESAAFIAALRAGRRPAPDLATALRSVQIAEAVDRGESVTF